MKVYFYQLVDAGFCEWSTDPQKNEENFVKAACKALDGPAMITWSTMGLVAVKMG